MSRFLKKITLIVFIFLILTLSCDDDDNAEFEGILLRDNVNLDMGTFGTRDLNDWQNDGSLSDDILDLLAFDADDLIGTTTSSDVYISAYPNPVINFVNLKFLLNHNSRVRLVMINESMQVLYQTAFEGSSDIRVELTDTKKFPNKKIVRVYYSISSQENPNFYVGHGDILVCQNRDCIDSVK